MPNVAAHCVRLAMFAEGSAADASSIFYLRTKEDETSDILFFFQYQATYKIHKSINSKFKIFLSEAFKTEL